MRLASDPIRRRRLVALAAVAAVAGAVGLAVGGRGDGSDDPSTPSAPPAPALPLEQQVGQLLVMSFDGTRAPSYIRRRLRNGEGAGVILFGPNVAGAASLRRLTRSIQRAGGGQALIAVDQEGGEIRNVPFVGPAAAQSSLLSPGAAGRAASEAARGLGRLGVNVNLAPVADVSPPGGGGALTGRIYPGGGEEVAAAVAAAVRAHEREGVAATVKHYPGLGRAAVNTDDGSVSIGATRAQLEATDLEPFRAAVEAEAPLVMVGHALYPALDPHRIASQSKPLLRGTLRDRLGYRGVIVTDSIEAQAVLDRSGVATAAERSVEAGADLILMTGSGSWNLVYPRLLRRARRSSAFRERVSESARRVIALKRKLGDPSDFRVPLGVVAP
jgi:beta-N-acetylhexosaminidase